MNTPIGKKQGLDEQSKQNQDDFEVIYRHSPNNRLLLSSESRGKFVP